MSNKIQIQNGQAEGYTAKEAMRRVVEAVQDRTAHAIEVFTIEDEKGLEAESLLFAKMFMRFLHKNQGRVLLLAENDIMLSKLVQYVKENYEKIRVVEIVDLVEHGVSADMILNSINGAEAEYIIAALPTELQDDFISQYRSALDAKIWFGIGTQLKKKESHWFQKFWSVLLRHFSKKEK